MRKVEIVPHDPKWRNAFSEEKQHILQVFGDNVVAVHHVGSQYDHSTRRSRLKLPR